MAEPEVKSEYAQNPDAEIFENLNSRLFNWKFNDALRHAETLKDKLSEEELDLIRSLAATLGNCGWIDGHLCTIVGAALNSLPKYKT